MNNEKVIIPGEKILELLRNNSMSQLDLADKTGIHKKTINEIINGKAPITNATALKLEYVFGVSSEYWNKIESEYRDSIERQKDIESVKSDEKYLKNIPYKEMAKRGWVIDTKDSYERVINLRKFFSVASLSFDTDLKRKISFRKSANKKVSIESLYCWLRFGEIESNRYNFDPFDTELLKQKALDIRLLAGKTFIESLDEIKTILRGAGVSLVYESHLPNTYVNGVSYKISNDKAIIMISDRGKRDDILWFTLFHEIAHLLKHSKKGMFLDLDNRDESEIEKEADNYARNILIDDEIYNAFVGTYKKLNVDIIKQFSVVNNITPGVLVGRLQKDGIIGWNRFNELVTRV